MGPPASLLSSWPSCASSRRGVRYHGRYWRPHSGGRPRDLPDYLNTHRAPNTTMAKTSLATASRSGRRLTPSRSMVAGFTPVRARHVDVSGFARQDRRRLLPLCFKRGTDCSQRCPARAHLCRAGGRSHVAVATGSIARHPSLLLLQRALLRLCAGVAQLARKVSGDTDRRGRRRISLGTRPRFSGLGGRAHGGSAPRLNLLRARARNLWQIDCRFVLLQIIATFVGRGHLARSRLIRGRTSQPRSDRTPPRSTRRRPGRE